MDDIVVTTWLHEFKTILKFQVLLQGTDTTVPLMMLIPCPQFLPVTTRSSPALPCLYVFPFPTLPLPFQKWDNATPFLPPRGEVLRYL